MTKLSDIIDGFVKTFTLDDIHNPQPKQSVCRECEIVGSAASMTGAAYLYHITKMGKIMPIPGIFFTTSKQNLCVHVFCAGIEKLPDSN